MSNDTPHKEELEYELSLLNNLTSCPESLRLYKTLIIVGLAIIEKLDSVESAIYSLDGSLDDVKDAVRGR